MAKDPYRYFRIEAQEILDALMQGVLDIERGGASADLINRLLRHAHTLKGAARIVGQSDIAEASHAVEEILSPFRQGQTNPDASQIAELLRHLDLIDEKIKVISPTAAPSSPRPADEPTDTIRVEIQETDRLLRAAGEANVHLSALATQTSVVDNLIQSAQMLTQQLDTERNLNTHGTRVSPKDPRTTAHDISRQLRKLRQDMGEKLDLTARELRHIQDSANDLRLVPASTVFAFLSRAARDAAASAGKDVEFIASGGDHRLDSHVLAALRDALLHVVRNAIAHGIEPPPQRLSAGKSPRGRVELSVERRGDRLAFICRDDGQGLDVQAIRNLAVERKVITEQAAESLDVHGIMDLLLRGGMSTSATVTQLSGRGVGLSVVREVVAHLKGEVRTESEPGEGTIFEIIVPISLESLVVLEVQAAGAVLGIPFDSVRRTLRVKKDELAHSPDGDSLLYQGQTIPFVPLDRIMGLESKRTIKPAWSAVIVECLLGRVALGVDRLLQRCVVVVRPLPAIMGRVDLMLGASFDPEGNPQPVLNPAGLVEAARRNQRSSLAIEPMSSPEILVIDDSLTTRMLEQTILESAGYKVDLAVSAENGLEKARQRRYSLFVVDVEMPGMDGFSFIEQTRGDRDLQEIPAILVTSRASPADRLRGEQVGAKAYIIKSEFDETEFLRTIRGLVG